jgi:Protein of unknown function (DUF3995)
MPAITATESHRAVAVAAAAWAFIFGCFHFIWAAGWYVGLDAEQARKAFAVPWKLAYDIAAGVMCIIAVPTALGLAMPWGRRVARRLISTLAWIGTALLVLRAVASVAQTVYEMVTGKFSVARMGIWEPWFYLGAILFAANLRLYSRRQSNVPA